MPTASSAKRPVKTWVPHLPPHRVPHLRDGLIVAKVGAAALLFALLVLPLDGQPPTLSTGQTLTATVTSTTTLLHLGHRRILLKRDNTVARPTPAPTLKLIAELPGKVIVLTDTYPSRPMGLSRCQAGEEQFLRVISLSTPPAVTYQLKLASCHDTIDLFEGDELKWSPTAKTLDIHWITPPTHPRLPGMLLLHVAPDGQVVQLPRYYTLR